MPHPGLGYRNVAKGWENFGVGQKRGGDSIVSCEHWGGGGGGGQE